MNILKNNIRKKQIAIAKELDRICTKHNIQYFANGGTLIGCYRHSGFIPWDDDMDFLMTRANFDKFLRVVKQELKEPYIFNSVFNNDIITNFVNRIIDTSTTCIYSERDFNRVRNFDIPRGIFIDIFVFDSVPEDYEERCKYIEDLQLAKKAVLSNSNAYLDGIISYDDYIENHKNLVMEYYYTCIKYNNLGSIISSDTSCLGFKHQAVWLDKWISKEAEKRIDFEDIKLPVPIEGKKCLDRLYPRWDKEFVQTHSRKWFFDTENSYVKYYSGELIPKW